MLGSRIWVSKPCELHRTPMAAARWLLIFLLAAADVASDSGSEETDSASRRPRYARVNGNIETVWQRPPGSPKGIFFIAHGCKHQGTDIFSEVGPDGWRFDACKTSNFRRCLGLPEEIALREAARARGYVAMAVSGGRGQRSCWDFGRDAAKVQAAVEHVRQAEGLPENAPILATGASSGGGFLGALAAPLEEGGLPHLRCILPQIMDTSQFQNRGVPALYVHMPKDVRTADRVRSELKTLEAHGIRADELLAEARPVTTELLSRCLAGNLASDVMEALRSHKPPLLDDAGYLLWEARSRHWVPPVREALARIDATVAGSDDSLLADESCLAEVMNVAWARHEFTSQFATEMLDFCEKNDRSIATDRAEL